MQDLGWGKDPTIWHLILWLVWTPIFAPKHLPLLSNQEMFVSNRLFGWVSQSPQLKLKLKTQPTGSRRLGVIQFFHKESQILWSLSNK